jgi:hypothetical protein
MSDQDRPELVAFQELEKIVRRMSEELAAFRRRALTAEARLRDIDSVEGGGPPSSAELTELRKRVQELEADNETLRDRMETAAGKTKQMLDRIHFLRQQAQTTTDRTGGGDR